jgi:hypothetical protein
VYAPHQFVFYAVRDVSGKVDEYFPELIAVVIQVKVRMHVVNEYSETRCTDGFHLEL